MLTGLIYDPSSCKLRKISCRDVPPNYNFCKMLHLECSAQRWEVYDLSV